MGGGKEGGRHCGENKRHKAFKHYELDEFGL